MSTPSTLSSLRERVRHYVACTLQGQEPEPFDDLAWSIFAHQVSRCPARPPSLGDTRVGWRDLPSVPVDLFKRLRIGGLPPEQTPFMFQTSGTTTGLRGRHHLTHLDLYELGSLSWMRACVHDGPEEVVALLDDPDLHPDSSLSHMVSLFAHGSGQASWHTEGGRLNATLLNARITKLKKPVFVATTSFALDEWIQHAPSPLPMGSVLMVTGGFKGRTHHLDAHALCARAQGLLKPSRLITEYGMTELSSQLWGTPETPYAPPPWLRCVSVDPKTGNALADGLPGQLKFVDLCNVDAAVAIETLDAGVVHTDGTVTLHGRLPGAPVRGCSLTVEEAWAQP